METTKYIWMNGKFVAWEDARVHVLTHALHYGSAAFEGIRCYAGSRGPGIFRLREHIERLFYSSGAIGMKSTFSVDQVVDAAVELVRRNEVEACYVRPLMYYGYGVMGLDPRNAPVDTMIACWPWGKYLPGDSIRIKISKYIRIHPRSTIADAKISGHYINSILTVLETRGEKYHEALLLDFEGYIAEGPGENIFIVKDRKIFTPPLGRTLAGITRASTIEVARDLGISVTEKMLTPEELFSADEAFFTGTAAEITPISAVDDRQIGAGRVGPISAQLRDKYAAIVRGQDSKYEHWLTWVRS